MSDLKPNVIPQCGRFKLGPGLKQEQGGCREIRGTRQEMGPDNGVSERALTLEMKILTVSNPGIESTNEAPSLKNTRK